VKVKVVADDWRAPLELIFGKSARGGTYVRQPGHPEVFLAAGRFGGMVHREANSFRKHAVLSLKADELTEVSVKPAAGDPYSFARGQDGDGAWKLKDAPAGFRFDSDAAQRQVQQLAGVSAQDFVDDGTQAAALGLGGAHDVIEAKLKDGKSVVLHFGQPPVATAADAGFPGPPGRWALSVDGDAQAYWVAPYLHAALVKPRDELRDLSLLHFDVAKVKMVSIHGQKPVVLKKEGTGWKVTVPKELPTGLDFDEGQVTAQLGRLGNLRAARYLEPLVPDAKAGLEQAATVELTLEDGTKQSLRFGKEVPGVPGKQRYVRGSADGRIYAVLEPERVRFDEGVALFKRPPPMPNFGGGMAGIKGLESLPPDVRRQLEAQLRQHGAGPVASH
jgi:hypothetical protein